MSALVFFLFLSCCIFPCILSSFTLAPHHAKKITSQSGQDGYLEEIFAQIGTTNRYYVEFGFNSNKFNGGSGSNTYNLYKNHDWQGLLLDGGHANARINLHAELVCAETIVSVFDKYDVPYQPDYVSIDIDSYDLWLFGALIAGEYPRPRVLTVEYNSNWGLDSYLTVGPSPHCSHFYNYNGTRAYGASLAALEEVGDMHGYYLVGVVNRLDLFFVRKDIIPDFVRAPMEQWLPYVLHPTHHRIPMGGASQMIDWVTYNRTRDISLAHAVALSELKLNKKKFTIQ